MRKPGYETSPILSRIRALAELYTRATGSSVSFYDHEGKETIGETDCCREIHLNAIRESMGMGSSHSYVCSHGNRFWTSPIYLYRQYAGALVSGALGDAKESKIRALAELLLVCSRFLSIGSEDHYKSMKQRAEQTLELSAKIAELKNICPSGDPGPEYLQEREKQLLRAIRLADIKSAKTALNEIMALVFSRHKAGFGYMQYRATELAVLISRTDAGLPFITKNYLEANNHYIKSIQQAAGIEELCSLLHQILDRVAGQFLSFRGIQHVSALKKAEYYILENFTRKISLKELAKISGFSAPYFSTIFKEEMGENLSDYIKRLKIEKAAYMLTETRSSLSKISRICGFGDQSWFSKTFKQQIGVSPGKYRDREGRLASEFPKIKFAGNLPHLPGSGSIQFRKD